MSIRSPRWSRLKLFSIWFLFLPIYSISFLGYYVHNNLKEQSYGKTKQFLHMNRTFFSYIFRRFLIMQSENFSGWKSFCHGGQQKPGIASAVWRFFFIYIKELQWLRYYTVLAREEKQSPVRHLDFVDESLIQGKLCT